MTGDREKYRIVGSYMNHSAPTGEGERFITEDGRHWRRTPPFEQEDETGREITRRLW